MQTTREDFINDLRTYGRACIELAEAYVNKDKVAVELKKIEIDSVLKRLARNYDMKGNNTDV